jgi:hypothetical protein
VKLREHTVGYVRTIKMLNEEMIKIQSSEIWCRQWFGYMGEVMTNSRTFIHNGILCFYPPLVLCVKFLSW